MSDAAVAVRLQSADDFEANSVTGPRAGGLGLRSGDAFLRAKPDFVTMMEVRRHYNPAVLASGLRGFSAR
jgi:hypothetical protein